MKKYTVLILCLLMSSCTWISRQWSDYGAESDIQMLCAVANEFDWQQSDDVAELTTRFYAGIYKNLKSKSVRDMLQALSVADSAQKWGLFERGLKELNIEGFNCPKFKKAFMGDLKSLNPAIE